MNQSFDIQEMWKNSCLLTRLVAVSLNASESAGTIIKVVSFICTISKSQTFSVCNDVWRFKDCWQKFGWVKKRFANRGWQVS